MNWSDVGDIVKKVVGTGAPLLGSLFFGPAGGAVGKLVASVLGCDATPDAVSQAIQADPQAAAKIVEIETNAKVQLQQLAVQAEQNRLIAETAQIASVNSTMQKEDETRKFSWRDYWGYVSGTAFAFVVAVVIFIVFMAVHTDHYELLANIPPVVGAFSVLFGIAAGVLGVQASIEAHHAGMVDRIEAEADKFAAAK